MRTNLGGVEFRDPYSAENAKKNWRDQARGRYHSKCTALAPERCCIEVQAGQKSKQQNSNPPATLDDRQRRRAKELALHFRQPVTKSRGTESYAQSDLHHDQGHEPSQPQAMQDCRREHYDQERLQQKGQRGCHARCPNRGNSLSHHRGMIDNPV
jgi:hypothetical protein